MSHLVISKKNEVYLQVKSEPHVYYELSDYFTFDVPGAKFMPQYRNKYWDGKIRLFSNHNGEMYVGLLDKLIKFCEDHEYTYEFRESEYYGLPFEVNGMISKEGVKDYMTAISRYAPREYQVEGVYDALKHNRKLLISPTASGKSLMIYSIVRYYVEKGKNTLICTPQPSPSLVRRTFLPRKHRRNGPVEITVLCVTQLFMPLTPALAPQGRGGLFVKCYPEPL